METKNCNCELQVLENSELCLIDGGSFGYDVGAAIGFFFRALPGDAASIMYATAIWNYQYS